MQSLQREQLIRHASGDHKKEFVYGFFLYYVMQGLVLWYTWWFSKQLFFVDNKDGFQPIGDLQAFENEWLEVELRPPLNWGLTASPTALNVPNANLEREQGVPHFLCEEIDLSYLQSDLDRDCNDLILRRFVLFKINFRSTVQKNTLGNGYRAAER